MYSPYKRLTAQLLLFSFLLESCYNPNIGVSKKTLPTPKGATYQQHQYKENTCSKNLEPPTSPACTTADGQTMTFTQHNEAWQAEVCMPNGRRQLPVTFEPGYTIEDLIDKGPQEQQQLIHLCTNRDNIKQIDYVYVGKTEINKQYISKITTKQPKEHFQTAETNTQEQASLQTIPSPVQTIPASPNSQPQASSKPLPIPNSETFGYNNDQNKYNNVHNISNKRTLTLKNQHALANNQRAAQNKRTERAARNKPTDKPVPTAHLKQNTPSTTPQLPSPAAKTPQDITSPIFVAQGGQRVHFMYKNDQWQASVMERIGAFSRTEVLPVFCERHGDIAATLRALQGKPDKYVQQRIHVMTARQIPYVPKLVFIGEQSLKGGGDPEPSGSGEPSTRGPVGATDRRARPSLAATGRSASMALQERMAQVDITSTEGLVKSLNEAQIPEEQQNLQEWVRAYVSWFAQQPIETLTPALIQEYTCLADIRADQAGSRQLLASYFNSLCNKIQVGQYGEEPLIEALEYTLQTIDSRVFAGNPAPLIKLGNELLARLDPDKNAFNKATYPTHRSTLYALHQTLVLLKQIDPNRWDATQNQGLYSQFKAQVQAIAETAQYYYPICYHAQLLKQGLKRLETEGLQVRLQEGLRRVGLGLQAGLYFHQAARALAVLDLEVNTLMSGTQSLQAALTSQHIKAKPWYDALQQLNQSCLSVLEDGAQYASFRERLEALKDNKAIIRKEKYRKALRYGVVQQLSLLALEGPTAEIRQESTAELGSLLGSWSVDAEIRDALLTSLTDIHAGSQVGDQSSSAGALSRSLFSSISHSVRSRASAGSQGSSIEAMSATAVREGLKSYYQESDFAQVRSLFDGEAPKHVETLQCQLMLVEQVKVEDKKE